MSVPHSIGTIYLRGEPIQVIAIDQNYFQEHVSKEVESQSRRLDGLLYSDGVVKLTNYHVRKGVESELELLNLFGLEEYLKHRIECKKNYLKWKNSR